MITLGFTGTQAGMTLEQKLRLRRLITTWRPAEFHHGDCIGADEEAHDIVREAAPRCSIVIHPPLDMGKRAFKKGNVILNPLPYLDRNHAIVDRVERLIAAPKETQEQLRSGTWATVRYAKKATVPVTLLLPRRRP